LLHLISKVAKSVMTMVLGGMLVNKGTYYLCVCVRVGRYMGYISL